MRIRGLRRSGRISSIFVGTQRVSKDIHEVISVSDPFRSVSRKVAMAGQSPFSWDDWIWRHTSPLMSAENPTIFHHRVERSKFFLSRAEWMVDKLLKVIRQKVKTSLFTRGGRCLTMFNGVWLMMNGIDCNYRFLVCMFQAILEAKRFVTQNGIVFSFLLFHTGF